MQELTFEQVNVVSGGSRIRKPQEEQHPQEQQRNDWDSDSLGGGKIAYGAAPIPPSQATGWFLGVGTSIVFDALGGTETIKNGIVDAAESFATRVNEKGGPKPRR